MRVARMKNRLIMALLLAVSLIVFGCAQQPQTKCRDIQVPYSENPCLNELEINQKDWVFSDKPILSNKEGECSNMQGLGIANYGNMRLTWELVNKNNVLLTVPCKIIIKKFDQFSGDYTEEKVLETVNINIPSQNKELLTRDVYLPKCWSYMGIDCKDVKELPECQAITKYRVETKCD